MIVYYLGKYCKTFRIIYHKITGKWYWGLYTNIDSSVKEYQDVNNNLTMENFEDMLSKIKK